MRPRTVVLASQYDPGKLYKEPILVETTEKELLTIFGITPELTISGARIGDDFRIRQNVVARWVPDRE